MIGAPFQPATTHISSNRWCPAVRLRSSKGSHSSTRMVRFFKFESLEELIITSPGGMTFDNYLLELFSRSWLGMRHFELNLVSPSSLGSFRYKRTLEDLPFRPHQPYRCLKLKSMGVSCDSRVEAEPIVVATFLHNIFPNLSTIRSLENANLKLPDAWQEVQASLKKLVNRRERTLWPCRG